MSQNNGYVDGGRLVEAREKDVTVGDRKYRIRALRYEEIVELRGAMIDVSQMAIKARKGDVEREIDPKTMAAMRRLLVAGLVEPKLVLDPGAGATPDDLRYEDFFLVGAAIMTHSGAKMETGERIRP